MISIYSSLFSVKLHQKISKELDGTNENIKSTQASILALIEDLRQRDLDFANRILKAQTFKTNLKSLEASKQLQLQKQSIYFFSYK